MPAAIFGQADIARAGSVAIMITDQARAKSAKQKAEHPLALLRLSARPDNPSWKASDAQNLLEALVSPGEGLLRLAECIQWPSKSDTTTNWSFIRGTLPVLQYMSSDWIVKSTIAHNVNALYGILHENFKEFQALIESFMPQMMAARTFRDVNGTTTTSGSRLFKVIFVTLFEYTCRYKNALEVNLGMRGLIKQLAEWFYEWEASFESAAPFDDPLKDTDSRARRFIISELRKKVESLVNIVDRSRAVVVHQVATHGKRLQDTTNYRHEAILARLHREYQGPGDQRQGGSRHDNDKVNIQDIRIAPTQNELLCTLSPYLPANIARAPHQYPAEGIQRLLDVQFRLLREELVAPIRTAIQLIEGDLAQPKHVKTQLGGISKGRGGRYRGQLADFGQDSVIFSIYTGVSFGPFTVDKRGSSIGILMDSPPGDARHSDPKKRAIYWDATSKKRLVQGGLVALLLKDGTSPLEIFLGTISSNAAYLKESAKDNDNRIGIRVSFFDAEIELRIVRQLQEAHKPLQGRAYLLLEAPVLYEGIRPFLSAFQGEPEALPFADYLRHHADPEYLSRLPATPPRYAQQPGFTFELKSVLRGTSSTKSLRLDVNDPLSVTRSRQVLSKYSCLDKSQAEAVVDSLTREISLIQGANVERSAPNNKNKGKPNKLSKLEFWHEARDLKWLRFSGSNSKAGKSHELQVNEHRKRRLDFLQQHGQSSIPSIPRKNRPLSVLEKNARVWSLSHAERQTLFQHWKTVALERMGDSRLNDFLRLRDDHAKARQEYQNIQDQVITSFVLLATDVDVDLA
ncbi:hypothetical protein FRC07_013284 [Ceratobasidium sp. 392]|nr:hypothetical protein FRC07_013284 [Ceratobasidium sp. 392]